MQIANSLLPSLGVAWAVTVTLLYVFRPVAIGVGLVDYPGGRKLHEGVVPVVGGLAMYVGAFSGVLLHGLSPSIFISAVLASLLLVAVGVIDDRFSLPPGARFPAQIAAVLIMAYGGGFVLTDMGDPFDTGVINTGRFALPFTLLVAVSTINAYNYIDGLDGLAGSLAIVALVSITTVAGIANIFGGIALIVAAAAFGFLMFNFPVSWNRSVRTFMGDAGSMLLGFSIVWIMIGICQGPDRIISPVQGLWFAALPIFDFFTCFVRRILDGKSPFTPGRDHVHHILQRGGFTVRQRLTILVGIQAAYSIIGVGTHFLGVPDGTTFTAWALLGISQRAAFRLLVRRYRARRLATRQAQACRTP